ncbi:MAG: CDP-alcohol phosphatidyltransferase family protein [Candidatus ainarchaeum sp.]|nr:CDP-alcohol phosphatidyltransferase family protein [Candidatus ainarchaeum sp.]
MMKQDEGLKGIQGAIGKALAFIPLTPNQWTILSLLVALAAGAVIALQYNILLGLILFVIAALFDMIDGAVARARKEVSAFGGFLDGVVDRFVEAIFLFSLMFVPLPSIFVDAKIWLALTVFLGTCMPSFVRAYAEHKGVVSKEKALALGGICERSERLGIIIIGLAAGLAISMEYFIYALMLVCVLSLITVFQRILAVYHPKV